jgi:carboxyl-terminal processing protease
MIRKLSAVLLMLGTFASVFVAGVRSAPYIANLGVQPETEAASTVASSRTEQALSTFIEAWRLIESDYFGRPLDEQALVQGAIEGMVDALDDPYSAYLTPGEMSSAQSEAEGSLESLGMAVEKKDGLLAVIAPLAGSPAEQAGIQPGDVIESIDGRDTIGLTLGEAVRLLRGPAGSEVTLSIMRDRGAPFSLSIERNPLAAPVVQTRFLDNGLAYVNITSLADPAPRLLEQFLQQEQADQAQGLILDLRNNPGGYVDIAVEVAGLFIPDGPIVSEQSQAGTFTWSYADKGRQLIVDGPQGRKSSAGRSGTLAPTVPMAVLVNRGTASAAEVLAAALQDRGRALLVGEQTFGKGSVTGDYGLTDGSGIHLTNGQWFSPNGQNVSGQGLTPDIQVSDTRGDPDPVLTQALTYLNAGN